MALTLDSMDLDGFVDHTVQQVDELEVDLNVYELAAGAVGAGVVVSSVGICAMAAPTVVVPAVAATSGLAYAGYCKRNNLPIIPFTKDKDKDEAVKTPVTPAPVAAPQPGAVTNFSGQPEDIEGL